MKSSYPETGFFLKRVNRMLHDKEADGSKPTLGQEKDNSILSLWAKRASQLMDQELGW